MSAYDSLPPWQQHFVDLYVGGVQATNPTAAYRIARPDSNSPQVGSSKLMSRDEIRKAIDERLALRREQTQLDEEWIISRLQAVAERCMQPHYDQRGRLVRFVSDATNAVRALELLGKRLGLWTDKFAGPDGGPLKVVQVVKFYDEEPTT